MDAVASLYERNSLAEIVEKAAKRIIVPLMENSKIKYLLLEDVLLQKNSKV
jgi:hypothetical protein|tara:strand:+ start:330 stop:482 length:153 start_codon:yes stop_codon:yes gene_type:complete